MSIRQDVTEKLERVTDLGSKYPDEGLTPGNLNASVQAITQLAEVHHKFRNVQTTDSEINVSDFYLFT